ncbi:MAG: dienelactone hydrolase family protein [Pyrinomonadaceae bacterium]|nr:dienelactone hydrolase family protein [Pyrinomonadaceae bacterium]
MKTETLEFKTAKGATTAFVAMPDDASGETKAVVLVQEYWGLNDNIKDIAGRYAAEGFVCIAPDLYSGTVTTDKTEAAKLMGELEAEDGLDIINKAMIAATDKYEIKKFGITGFCMGGTYALEAACKLEGLHASAPFYGDVPDEFTLKGLKCPVLFVSGTKDAWINPEKVADLERMAKVNTLPIESVKYEADHAFFNNTRPEVYDEAAAKDAWARVIRFFNENL